MTVANSDMVTANPPLSTTMSDVETDDRGWLTLPLGLLEAFPHWASSTWETLQPILKDRARAAWHLALQTQPRTLLICAAVCLLAGFAVLAVAMLASVLVLLFKLAAIAFAGIALWQWVSGAARAGNEALIAVAQPVKTVTVKKETK